MTVPPPAGSQMVEPQFQPHLSYPPQQFQSQAFQQTRPSSQPQAHSTLPPHPPHGAMIPSSSPKHMQPQAGLPPGFQISQHPANVSQIHSQPPIGQHTYSKLPTLPPQHQVPPSGHPMMRPSQHQMAQHLMNPQTHMRSQRILQQQQFQQQQQQIQRYEEALSITDPLDCLSNRSLAMRRYTTNHAIMNSLFANPWTVNATLRGDHTSPQKRKLAETAEPKKTEDHASRTERLKAKLQTIQTDIAQSQKLHHAQVQTFMCRIPPDQSGSAQKQ
ncbi:hypothetical protein CROQUDRAFT_74473 [Cronartium quercuum f. sp. fusiforme G11]|uniref:Uncharacterized protein n=1 Tax=Cronartium quercuum f. sp. fusiforme G11 TaxID=708437 RepID=A0A9P6TF32_9BASI|nr:hypothetical protein CROQUDRAFT_74473 [Cronartium quercuum f. sp. fusiforme G11]